MINLNKEQLIFPIIFWIFFLFRNRSKYTKKLLKKGLQKFIQHMLIGNSYFQTHSDLWVKGAWLKYKLFSFKNYMMDQLNYAKILLPYYTPTRREGAILQSPCPLVHPSVCPSVHTFVTDISASTGRNVFIFDIYGFGMVTCTVSPLSRFTAHLLPVYRATYKWTSDGILSTT